MSGTSREVSGLQQAINRAALGLSLVLFVAIGAIWWRDRTREWETPRWDSARFAELSAPSGPVRTTWRVAVNPDCQHCRARLADLMRRRRDPAHDPALGVLLVDVRRRPDRVDEASRLDGGVYWDSSNVWRARWGHRRYGEVFVFAADGALVRCVGPEDDPASPLAR